MTKVHTLTHTHTRDTGAFTDAASAIHKALLSRHTGTGGVERRRRRQRHARADGFGRGGAATAWAAAAPSATSAQIGAVRARSGAGKRGGAGTRGGGGEQASGPRAARRTGDRQAGDGLESDRAQRSERADRRSAAADLEGVRSATVGVGGRPSCGEEGGRQVRVVRVALHRPVERRSSRDEAKHDGLSKSLRTPVKSAVARNR